MSQTIIGVDPGLNGGIAVLKGGKLELIKMPEQFMEMVELFKPYAGARASIEKITLRRTDNPRMGNLLKNVENLKNAMSINMINYQEVAPITWQNFHQLTLPKGVGEKGVNYDELKQMHKDLKHYKIHLRIESNVENDVVIADNVKHILNTSGKLAARKMLMDDFEYMTKYDLNKAIKQTEKEIEKFKSREKTIRKNRYKAKAQTFTQNHKITLKNCDALLILLYEKYNPKSDV